MYHKPLLWVVLLGNVASFSAMTYQTSYQKAVDTLMKEKILKSSLANEEYEVADKLFKSVLVADTTGYETVQQVIDRMAEIFFKYYKEKKIKFNKSDIFIRNAIVKFIDQLFGVESPALLTSEQQTKYEALWDQGANLDVLIERFWSKLQDAGLKNDDVHQFVYDNYFFNKSLISFLKLESPAEKMAKISRSIEFQEMMAKINAPAAKTSTAIVTGSPALASPQAQAATFSAVNSILTQSTLPLTPVNIGSAFQAVSKGDATPGQVATVLQTVAVTPQVVESIPNVGLFLTVNWVMNLMQFEYGPSRSVVIDQHNLGEFVQDHSDVFAQLIAQGMIVLPNQTPSAKGGTVVTTAGAVQPVALLTPEVITEIVRTVRPLYKNWTLVQSTVAQSVADALSGSQNTNSEDSAISNLPAAAQSVVSVMQQGANGLIQTLHEANIEPVAQASKSNTTSGQANVVLMVPITTAGDQAKGDTAQVVTTIPLVTTAQGLTQWSRTLNNAAPLPASDQKTVTDSLEQVLGISVALDNQSLPEIDFSWMFEPSVIIKPESVDTAVKISKIVAVVKSIQKRFIALQISKIVNVVREISVHSVAGRS